MKSNLTSRIPPFFRGHLFLFDKPESPNYTAKQGVSLLLIFIFMEVVRPFFLYGISKLAIAEHKWWTLDYMFLLILLTFFLVSFFAGIKNYQLGLYSWSRWTKTEKYYFIQIIPIAIVVFSFFNMSNLKLLLSRPNIFEIVLLTLLPQMIWGFYQEYLYRGLLQTELVRRWGTGRGVLISNLIFTFGPLHAYHFFTEPNNPSHLFIFVAIFCIGLLFSIIYKRSGNLWIVGVMHGVGDMFIEGLGRI